MQSRLSITLLAASALLCTWAGAVRAGSVCELSSPPHRVGLLELYTSEGCNSCPPADRWLSALRKTYPSEQVAALSFHVDYWNQLGWPDRFARQQYTRRQQEASTRNRADFVYTPQFLFDGEDIRPMAGSGTLPSRLVTLNRERAGADITAQASLTSGREVGLKGNSRLASVNTAAETFIALHENALSSTVTAGENSGKTLRHDFVVRALAGPFRPDAQGVTRLDLRIPLPADARMDAIGITIFTQDRNTGRVLQVAARESCLAP